MKSERAKPGFVKVHFRLEKDGEGYPPDDWEVMWASQTGKGLFRVDNIPFFARGVSPGDAVSVEPSGDELYFREVVERSATSVLRVFATVETEVQSLRDSLRAMNCESELSHLPRLFAVEVPASVVLQSVLAFLQSAESQGRLDYEEASVRQTNSHS